VPAGDIVAAGLAWVRPFPRGGWPPRGGVLLSWVGVEAAPARRGRRGGERGGAREPRPRTCSWAPPARAPPGPWRRASGPARVVQFAPDGIYVSASISHALHLAKVNAARHYVLLYDQTEWAGARVMAPEAGAEPHGAEAPHEA